MFETTKFKKKHGYTIHAVQGEDFENIIYIDPRNFFKREMLYTAISRAHYSNQIKFITGLEPVLLKDGYIYKITSPNTDLVYIGSTYNISSRWDYHNSKKNNTTSKKVLSAGDAIIEEIWRGKVTYNIDTKYSKELKHIETQYIAITENCVNQILTERNNK